MCPLTLCRIPEDMNPQKLCSENHKSCTFDFLKQEHFLTFTRQGSSSNIGQHTCYSASGTMRFTAFPCGIGRSLTIYFHMLSSSLLAVIQSFSCAQFELQAGRGRVFPAHAMKAYRGEEKCGPTHS